MSPPLPVSLSPCLPISPISPPFPHPTPHTLHPTPPTFPIAYSPQSARYLQKF
ncbi:MAG: hypothetical protein F6J93_18010 [Oscillatoria sp. SIO1A7]|nr:hypothetical protein [Oscillatoria sp. SIO1A7]